VASGAPKPGGLDTNPPLALDHSLTSRRWLPPMTEASGSGLLTTFRTGMAPDSLSAMGQHSTISPSCTTDFTMLTTAPDAGQGAVKARTRLTTALHGTRRSA
jgi:hypothetical protein